MDLFDLCLVADPACSRCQKTGNRMLAFLAAKPSRQELLLRHREGSAVGGVSTRRELAIWP